MGWWRRVCIRIFEEISVGTAAVVRRVNRRKRGNLKNNSVIDGSPSKTLRKAPELFYNHFLVARVCCQTKES